MEREGLTAKRSALNAGRGFTLIELMVSASILGLIGLAVLTTFGSGLHVYERVQSYGGLQTEILLLLEEMERDLSNTFSFEGLAFDGGAEKVAFPAIVETIETVEGEQTAGVTVGQISYYLAEDNGQKVLLRDQRDYSRAFSQDKREKDQSGVFPYVKDLKFSYYFFDSVTQEYGWKESWTSEEESLPMAVKIDLSYEDRGRDIQIVRTFFVPATRVIDETEEGEGEEEGSA